nr:hypothetical protein Y47D3A.8 - Caenorhabditis elegans [Caenorhabditis elegans]
MYGVSLSRMLFSHRQGENVPGGSPRHLLNNQHYLEHQEPPRQAIFNATLQIQQEIKNNENGGMMAPSTEDPDTVVEAQRRGSFSKKKNANGWNKVELVDQCRNPGISTAKFVDFWKNAHFSDKNFSKKQIYHKNLRKIEFSRTRSGFPEKFTEIRLKLN